MNTELDSPCPESRSGISSSQYGTLSNAWDDDTLENLEYTMAINFPPETRAPTLAKAKPRRALKRPSFAIHEDSKPDHSRDAVASTRQSTLKRKTQDGGLSILAQPAQRFQRPRVSFADAPNNTVTKSRSAVDSIGKQYVKVQPEDKPQTHQRLPDTDGLKKDVRRRTVYIPSEDTTVPTVFMSLFSPLKSTDTNINNTNAVPTDDTVPIYSLEARIAAKKQARASSVEKPRRAPLQQSKKVSQQSAITRDVMGRNGGKENVPPGYMIDEKKYAAAEKPPSVIKSTSEPLKKPSKAVQSLNTIKTRPVKVEKSATKPMGEKSSTLLVATTDMRDPKTSSKRQDVKRSVNSGSVKPSRGPKESIPAANYSSTPTQLSIPKFRPVSIDQQYPRFGNDISNPVMYEDDWLLHQEIVITQLVNGLFDSVEGKLQVREPESLRHELIGIYQSDAFVLIYKRLQASILYGALAPTKDILHRGSRLADDLGLKRSFLKFWSDTYDLDALRGAAETVIGRKMIVQPVRTSDGSSSSSAKQDKKLRRAVEAFLDTFLIRNLDKEENEDAQNDASGRPYRRTLLRSIMIIVLLDKARLTPGNSLPRCLFTSSSPHKSSSAALQALANLLLPSMGDINRQVNHLDCHLCYKQHQLQDYNFRIKNLAVDLRDGVILTRLVEVLLYPSVSHLEESPDSSTSFNESPFSGETSEYPLSQSLKFPCVSRAAKIFNVQIVLGALQNVPGINTIAKELCAEHIVDGYREKTIALLWLLVGKWGLAEMLDWNDARNEIVRLQKKLNRDSKARDLRELVYGSHEDLLITWASTLAQLQGLEVANLTTSFADGRVFESIVDEYEGFLLDRQDECRDSSMKHTSTADKGSLQSRLQALGCSSEFATLVAGSTCASRIFDRDFVLGALTFLCSRLLSSSKRIRAAITIQTAWRRITSREEVRRRKIAKDIAEQCAAVACTRERILWAKTTILKWWREQRMKKRKTGTKSAALTAKGRNMTRPSRRPVSLQEKQRNF